jgi:hypothetical protein
MNRLVDATSVRQHKRTKSNPLTASTLEQLLRIAAQHTPVSGGGRCSRCGIIYAEGTTLCPTLKSIRQELTRRDEFSVTPFAQPSTPSGVSAQRPCLSNPALWDTDRAPYRVIVRAIELCAACPLLTMCRETAEEDRANGRTLSSMVWAGVPYDGEGDRIQLHALRGWVARREGQADFNANRSARSARATGAAA